ncbi:MAG TPA: ABC transporter ATP-binding protein, partial [Limnochordia bacterium]
MIAVEHVTKRYGNARGVEDITFEVSEGEIVGFLGPNGAGKTTTLRVITGYHPPTSGRVTVAGYDVFEQPDKAKRLIGYLPENPPLYRDMTVREYLEFVARVKHVPKARRKRHLEEIAQRVGIEDVYTRLVRNISKGYRQRVGLAQALVGNPPVLVLDEPTVGLDPKQIIEIRELLRELGEEHTVILSSHILPEVSQLCERVVIINQGQLVAVDTPSALSHRLHRAQRLLARIDGPKTDVQRRISELSGVATVKIRSDDGPVPAFEIEAQEGADVRRDLFFSMAEGRWPIIELKPLDLSLEEVFLQLTTEEAELGSAVPSANGERA